MYRVVKESEYIHQPYSLTSEYGDREFVIAVAFLQKLFSAVTFFSQQY